MRGKGDWECQNMYYVSILTRQSLQCACVQHDSLIVAPFSPGTMLKYCDV